MYRTFCLLAIALSACASRAEEPTEPTPPIPLIVEIDGEIDEGVREVVVAKLSGADAGQPIEVHINTDGGELDASFAIARALERAAEGHAVRCVVDGGALSGGFAVLQSCATRVATARSHFMMHESYIPMASALTADKMRRYTAQMEADTRRYVEHCAARLRVKPIEVAKRIHGREWWLGPEEALALGAIDEVVPSPNSKLRPARTEPPKETPKEQK